MQDEVEVTIEKGLSEVAEELKQSGFEVTTLGKNTELYATNTASNAIINDDDLQNADIIVIEGEDQEIVKEAEKAKGEVINAGELSVEQVKQKVEEKAGNI